VAAQAAAYVEAIATGDHDVQQEERRSLPLGVGNQVGRGMKEARGKTRGFQVMLHKTCNIRIVFKYKYRLAQPLNPRPAALLWRI
jgi:hypothetical protein